MPTCSGTGGRWAGGGAGGGAGAGGGGGAGAGACNLGARALGANIGAVLVMLCTSSSCTKNNQI